MWKLLKNIFIIIIIIIIIIIFIIFNIIFQDTKNVRPFFPPAKKEKLQLSEMRKIPVPNNRLVYFPFFLSLSFILFLSPFIHPGSLSHSSLSPFIHPACLLFFFSPILDLYYD